MALSVQRKSSSVRVAAAAVLALVAGTVVGIAIALATVGLLPFIAGATLECTVNGNGTVTTCTSDGHVVKVPHHIHVNR